MTTSNPRRTWNLGYLLLIAVPFLGLAINFGHPPRWLQIAGIIAMVALVGAGSTLLRRRSGGWRPSETLTGADDDVH